ncbi:protein-disulfide reductase DsbD domain-containing protein, partial [Polaromonas sp.]|uniref:protein-disulfide reductase DsbD domain-containing protein n=1 Tax=Polaromonas sp. TaxID=1869339 RepID=UPI003CC2AC64
MIFQRFASALFFIAVCVATTGATAQISFTSKAAPSAVVNTDQVKAELLAWAPDGVDAGKPVWVGLQLAHIPEWHTYWKNSGDSGLPTLLEWTLPAGVSAGEIAWPTPKKIPIGTLANYGYEGTVLLPVPLTVAPGFNAANLDIRLKASWLVCKKECIPQEGDFALRIPARSSTASSGTLFAAAFAASPQPLPAAGSQVDVGTNSIKVALRGLPAGLQGKTLAFFPETGSVIEPAGAWQQAWQGPVWTAQLPLSGQRTESPRLMPVVVALDSNTAYRIEAPVQGEWQAAAAAAIVPPALEAALKANAALGAPSTGASAPSLTLMAALLGALLGGIILN